MTEFIKFLTQLSRVAKLSLGFATLLLVAVSVWVLWQLWHPQLELLQDRMQSNEVSKLASELDAAKIEFEIGPDGKSILVPAVELTHARQKMAMSGMAGGGRVGFEAFDESSLGTTDFAQRINYQRALQGELERTIESVLSTQGVRVHLSLPNSRGLLQEKRLAKASVFVATESLEPTQVLAIQRIVTGAVDGMTRSQVSVVSGNGSQLDAIQGQESAAGSATAHTMQLAQEERRLEDRLRGLLQRFVPTQEIGIAANVEMNFDRIERREQISGDAELSRSPAQSASISYLGDTKATTTEARKIAPGTLTRISVAILLPKNTRLPSDEVLRRLISAAVGLNEARGDALEVSYLSTTAESINAPASATLDDAPARESIQASSLALDRAKTSALAAAAQLPKGAIWIGMSGLLLTISIAGIAAFRAGRRAQIPYDRDAAMARLQSWLGEKELSLTADKSP
jgi:flagellar M-ring protein FliF